MSVPLHRFLLTLQAAFRGPQGQASMKVVNAFHSYQKKEVPLAALQQAQNSTAAQLMHFGVRAEDVVDVSILNVCYLGLMTDAVFEKGYNGPDAKNQEPEKAVTAASKVRGHA